MPYYDTIEEDLARAKAILAKGEAAHGRDVAGTIYGGDIYAASKLLESFVTEIERVHTLIREFKQAERAVGQISAKDPLFPAVADKLWNAIDAVRNCV